MTTVTGALIETFQKGVALTPKEAFYVLQHRGIQTTYKSVSRILSRLYYRGILNRSDGRYIFSPGGRHHVSDRATQGDSMGVQGDTKKTQCRTEFLCNSVSNRKKVKRNGIRSKKMRRLMAILMNNGIEFFDVDRLYKSLLTKYDFKLNRNTYRVLIYRLKKRGFLKFRWGSYYVNQSALEEFFAVSNSGRKGATTPGVPKTPVQSELSWPGGTPSSVSIRISEHAPRVDIRIGPHLARDIIRRYNLPLMSEKDPSKKRKYEGRHLDAIITKNGYVMIAPKSSQWLQEVKEVFGEGPAADAKIQNAMKHKEYSLGDIKKLYHNYRFGAQVDYSEFSEGDIGFQGDAEKVELASQIFERDIMLRARDAAEEADILVELKRTANELKDLSKSVEESLTGQALLNSMYLRKTDENVNKINNVAEGIVTVANELKTVMQQFLSYVQTNDAVKVSDDIQKDQGGVGYA